VLADLPIATRLLFAYLPMMADCEGRLEDRPRRIIAELFPYDIGLNIDEMLNDLAKADFIVRYKYPEPVPKSFGSNSGFIWIKEFTSHQHPHKQERDKGSTIPEFSEEIGFIINNGTTTEQVPKDNGIKREDSLNPLTDSLNLIPDSPVPIETVTGPKKTEYQINKETATKKRGLLISKVINAYKEALSKDSNNSSPNVKRLLLALSAVPEVKRDHRSLLAFIIQAKQAKNVEDRVGFCIKLIKEPNYASADSCMEEAKKILNHWYPPSESIAKLTPDLRPND